MKLNSGRLPEGFVLAKPVAQAGYQEAVIYELEKNNRLVMTRKRDGYKVLAVIYGSRVNLYTAGLNEVDGRLDHIREEIAKLRLPSGTILAGECLMDESGTDNYTEFISFFKAKHSEVNYKVKFMVFDIVFYGSKDMTLKTYSENLELTNKMLAKNKLRYVFPASVLNMTFDQAKDLVRKKGWEGLVLRDKNSRLKYRLDGKEPNRPKGCYKWKPILEDDFIATRWRPNSDNPRKMKDIIIEQIDPKTKERFECGKIGGFKQAMKKQLLTAEFPFVMEVAFEHRFEKSGKLRNARFVRLREDKPIHECIASRSYPEAEYS
ncbi:MAG: hypothetical protein HYT62_01210, partial [Candidatus Yanofskybacteria bacterium]|nr:hypothetical protein [Candidatus Yanofskybacteria bacterium]